MFDFWPVYSGERFRASWPSCFATALANRSNVGSHLHSVIVIGVVVWVIVSNHFYPLCLAQFLSDEFPSVMKLHLSLHHDCVSTVLVSCAAQVLILT